MKRILSLTFCLLLMVSLFTGCGEKDRILYNDTNLEKVVTLGNYKGIKVDTSSDEYKELYNDIIANQVIDNDFHATDSITEGTVKKGDIANIDYVGKKDGVAFEGGTADAYDLTIGSGSFIPGFEEGLIGKTIGDTVDINLSFPEDYHSADLAGKAVVFTVTINSVKPALSPEEFYSKLGYGTVIEYNNETKKTVIENFLLDTFLEGCKIKEYPQKDKDFLLEQYTGLIEKNLSNQGATLDDYLSYLGQSREKFEETTLKEQVLPIMETQLPIYALIDSEEIKITKSDIDNKINELISEAGSSSITKEQLLEYYGEYYFEELVYKQKAIELIYENAKIS